MSNPAASARYQVFIDRGGTFTDCIGIDSHGSVRVTKVLSSDRAPLDGIRALLDLAADAPIPPCDIRMGTTLATNALLERRGAKTALLISEGFGDLLEIGDQTRPDLFALRIERPAALAAATLELSARCAADGGILSRPDEHVTKQALRELAAQGIESLAIVFLHAYRNPELELLVGHWASELGFRHIALSHQVSGELGFLARASTTLIDAHLTPILSEYMATLARELHGSQLRVMQSSGDLIDAAHFRGRNAILSGPAGGVVACAHIASERGLGQVLGIDMGGTSTDVSRYSGELERDYQSRVQGLWLRAPSLAIHTVAAGGGSICRFDGKRFYVGPESAGADPGPLCYGRAHAHELTLTDVNLLLGRLPTDRFPFPLDERRALTALEAIAVQLTAAGDPRGPYGAAAGFFELAIEHMAEAIRKVSVQRGHDAREHALIVFGGAGGQHACAVARKLGVRQLIFHPLAGVLSAFGIGVADVAWHGDADAGRATLSDGWLQPLAAELTTLETRGRAELAAQGHAGEALAIEQRVDLRYRGTDTALSLRIEPLETLAERFTALHAERYGYARRQHAIEVVALRVSVIARGHVPTLAHGQLNGTSATRPVTRTSAALWTGERFEDVPLYQREQLAVDQSIEGPALILEGTGTIVIERGFRARLDALGYLNVIDHATRDGQSVSPSAEAAEVSADPVRLTVFANQFMSIAEQMGLVLQRTALSTNIRERQDFSCALFDHQAELVANAPHIPVHLGAMSESVRAVSALHPNPQPGDVYVTNDPALGGSHLPDITVVTPVFDAHGSLQFFTASRGHHADIGGISPGSMPPFSRTLADEGAVFRGIRIVRGGVLDEALIRRVLLDQPHPARDVAQNLADLQAQIAANQTGATLLLQLAERFGTQTVLAYMRHTLDDAQAKVEAALSRLGSGEHRFADSMDDGTPVVVTLRIDSERARMRVDFTGSGDEVDGNLNAPRAVTVAAVLYVLRLLAAAPIPLNSGCLRPIELIVPEPSLLAPSAGRAVVAGNVETSQRIVDVLLGALGKLAACQGTMNNLTFGDDSFGYYETIAGGAGAGEGFVGASGVHTHMTNTRITDPEVLESRYPVRLWRFALRPGSGGAGCFRGGDGVTRELEALRALDVSIVSSRRLTQPFGLHGGEAGAVGHNQHAGRELPGCTSFRAAPGERIRIDTPGGGGYGKL